ncbi:hypothetical protein P175DRAFT_0530346 [Aspergillus ochraceoroseus IBT 24754]|uniref:Uncharacterized protein n=1 Tax=Aspergillus ochraceoroseus IBT 24754 TaxID=1392256 RepID=A0A2T5M3Y3_9EURO|nr:uncharacterized protein P175DRAFT_0530346 [Aspergillus ochraceoroseus IBT 24754]PTU23240.1 hypothetical protein P175DRAFT_0530346 [Aspergillus ochraceoroseus IBT 24754]
MLLSICPRPLRFPWKRSPRQTGVLYQSPHSIPLPLYASVSKVLPILPVLFRRVLLYESLDPELFQIKDVNNVLLCIAALQFGAAVFGANNMTLRYKTWRALIDDLVQTRHQAAALLAEIMGCSRASTRRTLNTINMAVSTFYAQALFHHRLLYPPCPPSTLHRLAVTNIVEIARKQHMSDPRLLRRLHWPLLMALRERLLELREFHSEYRWANDIADEVLARQVASQGQYADVAESLRRRCSQFTEYTVTIFGATKPQLSAGRQLAGLQLPKVPLINRITLSDRLSLSHWSRCANAFQSSHQYMR